MEIPASEVEAHQARLLDEVERGQTIVSIRNGKPIARIARERGQHQAAVHRALAERATTAKREHLFAGIAHAPAALVRAGDAPERESSAFSRMFRASFLVASAR